MTYLSYLLGALSGLICVGALALGTRFLSKEWSKGPYEEVNRKNIVIGLTLMIGQFLILLSIVYFLPSWKNFNSIHFAFSLLGGILVGVLMAAKLTPGEK